jgi:phage repressor protein C with HTH and peptisase S24 domain
MEYRLKYTDDATYQNDMLILKFSNSEASVKTLTEQDNNDLVFTNCNPVRSK